MAETTAVPTVSDAGEQPGGAGQHALELLLHHAGLVEHTGRVRVRVRGEDRVRWLNGMVTNTVKDLPAGEHNYSFLLNAQGRIQGDLEVFARAEELVLETDSAQVDRVTAHLERFIIMDDVELLPAENVAAMQLAGPGAAEVLAEAGLPTPGAGAWVESDGVEVVGEWSPSVPRYTLWTVDAEELRARLVNAGAAPVEANALEALRVLEGTPRFDADITDKHLPQETGAQRALHFQKGCYLGQEIVERIRSRASVHKGMRLFTLAGEASALPAPLSAGQTQAGELTSVAQWHGGLVALGTVRLELLDRGEPLSYPGGTAHPLEHAPLPEK